MTLFGLPLDFRRLQFALCLLADKKATSMKSDKHNQKGNQRRANEQRRSHMSSENSDVSLPHDSGSTELDGLDSFRSLKYCRETP